MPERPPPRPGTPLPPPPPPPPSAAGIGQGYLGWKLPKPVWQGAIPGTLPPADTQAPPTRLPTTPLPPGGNPLPPPLPPETPIPDPARPPNSATLNPVEDGSRVQLMGIEQMLSGYRRRRSGVNYVFGGG